RPIAEYHAWLASRIPTSPPDFRIGRKWPFEFGPFMDRFRAAAVFKSDADPDSIAGDVQRHPAVNRIIIWDFADPDDAAREPDTVLQRLGTGWSRAEQKFFARRRYWTWEESEWFCRRQYVKRNG